MCVSVYTESHSIFIFLNYCQVMNAWLSFYYALHLISGKTCLIKHINPGKGFTVFHSKIANTLSIVNMHMKQAPKLALMLWPWNPYWFSYLYNLSTLGLRFAQEMKLDIGTNIGYGRKGVLYIVIWYSYCLPRTTRYIFFWVLSGDDC